MTWAFSSQAVSPTCPNTLAWPPEALWQDSVSLAWCNFQSIWIPIALIIFPTHLVTCIYYTYYYLSICVYLGTHKHPSSQLGSMLLKSRDHNSCSAFSAAYTIPPGYKYNEIFITKGDNDKDLSKTVLAISVQWDSCTFPTQVRGRKSTTEWAQWKG